MTKLSFLVFELYMAFCLIWYVDSYIILSDINALLHYKNARNLITIKWLCAVLVFLLRKNDRDFNTTTTHKSILFIFIIYNVFFAINVFNIIFVICNTSLIPNNDISIVISIVIIALFLIHLSFRIVLAIYMTISHEKYKKNINNK